MLRSFPTSPSPFASRRSVLSEQAPAAQAEANLDFTEDPRADYLVAERTQPALTGSADPFAALRQLVRAFAPTATLRAFPLLEEDGVAPATVTWHVQLAGSEVRQPVKAQHASLPQLVLELKKKWAIERRATDIFRLVEQCQGLVGGCLDEDFEAALRRECAACSYAAFPGVAAKFRSLAAGHPLPQAA